MQPSHLYLFVFSPTGRCKALAGALASQPPFSPAPPERPTALLDLTSPAARSAAPPAFTESDWLIFLYPVHGLEPPRPFLSWLSGLSGKAAVTLLAAYGSIEAGRALATAAGLLREKGFRVISGAELPVSHSYNCDCVHVAENAPTPETLAKTAAFLKETYAMLKAGQERAPVFPSTRSIFRLLPPGFPVRAALAPPAAEAALCNSCRLCVSACPVGAIASSLALDKKRCIRCLACVKACPAGARKQRFRFPPAIRFLNRNGKAPKFPRYYL